MTDMGSLPVTDFRLPAAVISRRDLTRLIAEVESLDDQITQTEVRAKAGGAVQPVEYVISEVTQQFFTLNTVQIKDAAVRSELLQRLRKMKNTVPVIRMTFATEADIESQVTLVNWLRESIHPQALLAVGLQPALVAGVHVRTTNRVHDFSMRGALATSHDMLVTELEALRGGR